MFNLIKYELKKIFGVNKTVYSFAFILGTASMVYMNFFLDGKIPNNNVTRFFTGFAAPIMSLFFFMMLFYPGIKSIISLFTDINGYTAPLEAHLPYPSWMKILAKLIADAVFIAIGVLVAILSLELFIRFGVKNLEEFARFRAEILQILTINNPRLYKFLTSVILYFFTLLMTTIGFFSTVAAFLAAMRNKIKGSKIVSIIAGLATFMLFSFLNEKINLFLDRNFGNFTNNARDILFNQRFFAHMAVYTTLGLVFILIAGYIQDKYSDLN